MMTLHDVITLPHTGAAGIGALRNIRISGVCTDSRTIQPKNIFFALRGERFDGHSFVDTAVERGASCVVVDNRWFGEGPRREIGVPVIAVDDTTIALGQLAHIYRKKFRIPVIAVAGSNGKTTVKDMIADVLSARFTVLKTEGNLNNQIGVPMTLLRMNRRHQIAVIEHGTNHPGELEYLLKISKPTHSLITSIGREHLEFFSNLDGVAAEEGMVFRYGKFGFVNADDRNIRSLSRMLKRTVRYGFNGSRNDVRGKIMSFDLQGRARVRISSKRFSAPLDVTLSLPGHHSASNALAATAVGLHFGVGKKKIGEALEKFAPASKRMEMETVRDVTIVNDTYNANPDSVVAALATVAAVSAPGKKIVVLGDMLELGEGSAHEHARIGLEVADRGFEYLYTFGPNARYIHEASRLGFAQHFEEKTELIKTLCATVAAGDVVLVKGSRGMKMEEVIEGLKRFLTRS